MKTVIVTIEGTAPYSQSRKHDMPKVEKESPDAYEARTWRDKCTVDDSGEICIPAMAWKQALDAAAKLLGMPVPGKGKNLYTKHFKAGVLCEADSPIGVMKADVASVTISANSDGVRGSGKRVSRTFPVIPLWTCDVSFAVLDDTITKPVFEKHLTEAGRFVGIGRFRPENGGLNGRFRPVTFKWKDI